MAMSYPPAVAQTSSATPPPRKRRRRATAAGANDDCFACQKRTAKCDRKRPYCTQCIDSGKECSGYKTTLTWGVGVASRGKLRGLSCPIANKNIDGSDASPAEMESRRRKSSATSRIKKEECLGTSTPTKSIHTPTSHPATHASSTRSYSSSSATLPLPNFQAPAQWNFSGFHDRLQSRRYDHADSRPLHHPSLQRLHTQFSPPTVGYTALDTAGSVSSFGDAEFHSPTEYPITPGSIGYPDHLLPPIPIPDQGQTRIGMSADLYSQEECAVDPYMDPMSSSLESVMTVGTYPEDVSMLTDPADDDTFESMMFDNNGVLSFDELEYLVHGESEDQQKGPLVVDTRFSNPFFHLSPRMQSLMDYYEQTVCPYLVAFDGPENPYRKHILQLAMNNSGLQHAIAALAINNLRMRRKGPKSIGIISEIAEGFDPNSHDFNEPSPEESMHKQISIDHLNTQLTNSHAAQDDSVLATLLILCLFHVCDSGFSKFKTQLAGMQKLLALRNNDAHSGFTRWVQMFFMWFDVMTSTVNDREVQIKHESLDMLNFSADLGALEQFSGCDGPLFKLVARLGRLSLLAQGRPVQPQNAFDNPFLSVANRRSHKAASHASSQRMRRPSSSTVDCADNTGSTWTSVIVEAAEDNPTYQHADPHHPDGRQNFWFEWHEVRKRLQRWSMSDLDVRAPTSQTTGYGNEYESGKTDLIHINESFRFAALLYTERLGYPLLPSSHHQYQCLVSQALYHITSLDVTSCVNKFLLWPLFIIGTECVDEGHRNIIRSRCIEVQKESGFYNNISTLHVLERVWLEAGSNAAGYMNEDAEVHARKRDCEPAEGGKFGQAFRWRKAMDRTDGEYLVI